MESPWKTLRPMTKAEMREYISVYADKFSGWRRPEYSYFVRDCWPVEQGVGFEALRSGAYRPMHWVSIVPEPRGQLIHQLLGIKHLDVSRLQHKNGKWQRVMRAMDDEFVPSIVRPLDLEDVALAADRYWTELGRAKPKSAVALSILWLHVGREDRAMHWCERAIACPALEQGPAYDYELPSLQFAARIRAAVHSNSVGPLLASLRTS